MIGDVQSEFWSKNVVNEDVHQAGRERPICSWLLLSSQSDGRLIDPLASAE
jgi:hypothetical protein